MFTADFWRDAGRRAIRTFAQTLVALVGVNVGADLTAGAVDVTALPWLLILGTSALAGGLSLFQSLASTGKPVVTGDTETTRQTGGEGAGS